MIGVHDSLIERMKSTRKLKRKTLKFIDGILYE